MHPAAGVCARFDGYNSLECGGSSLINNATCYGDVTAFTATIVVCNERHLVNASDLVEITGSLRLTFLSSDITTLSFENLAVIGQDLYVADIDATTTTLSFPKLGNVSGSITFSSAFIETIELSALRVCASLSVSAYDNIIAMHFYFPVLEEVSGAMSFSGRMIRTIELPSLLAVGGSASFSSLYYMGSIAMPAVKTIGGDLYTVNLCAYSCTSGGSVDIHSLESIGGSFSIRYMSGATTINATRLQTLGSLYFYGLYSMTELSMTSLVTVRGQLYMYDASALTTLAFDSLVTIQGHLYMYEASALTTLAFDSLTTVEGYVYISGGTLLATAYLNSLTSVGVDLSDDDSGSNYNYYSSSQTTVSCDVTGESENVCIRDNAALDTIAFRSLDYDSFDIATPSGALV